MKFAFVIGLLLGLSTQAQTHDTVPDQVITLGSHTEILPQYIFVKKGEAPPKPNQLSIVSVSGQAQLQFKSQDNKVEDRVLHLNLAQLKARLDVELKHFDDEHQDIKKLKSACSCKVFVSDDDRLRQKYDQLLALKRLAAGDDFKSVNSSWDLFGLAQEVIMRAIYRSPYFVDYKIPHNQFKVVTENPGVQQDHFQRQPTFAQDGTYHRFVNAPDIVLNTGAIKAHN